MDGNDSSKTDPAIITMEEEEELEATSSSTCLCCKCSCPPQVWKSRTRTQRVFLVVFGCASFLLLLLLLAAAIFSHITRTYTDDVTPVPTVVVDTTTIAAIKQKQHKILIVGAGASGLFAGYTLQHLLGMEANFTILEASHRPGGRVQKTTLGGINLDVGAEFIHTNPQILQDLLLYPNDQQTVAQDLPATNMEYDTLSFVAPLLHRRVRRDWGRFFYKEYKFLSSTWAQYLETFVLPYVLDKIVYNAIVEKVEYNLTTTTATPTNSSNSPLLFPVTVTTQDGSIYHGHQVIMAVPLQILQDGGIIFQPNLPQSKLQLWQDQIHPPAPGGKILIEFQEPFYTDFTTERSLPSHVLEILSMSPQQKYCYNTLQNRPQVDSQNNKHILGCLWVGDHAQHWETASEEELLEEMMTLLDELYDGKASRYYLQHYIQNWSREPYIRGTYLLEGYTPKIEEPVSAELFFATDVAPCTKGHGAMVQCAAISGRKAAVAALNSAV